MTERNVISKNLEECLIVKNYFSFPDTPNQERVNSFKIYDRSSYAQIVVENGRNELTKEEKICRFRIDQEHAKFLRDWLNDFIGD